MNEKRSQQSKAEVKARIEEVKIQVMNNLLSTKKKPVEY